jgi:hypothetical protein
MRGGVGGLINGALAAMVPPQFAMSDTLFSGEDRYLPGRCGR